MKTKKPLRSNPALAQHKSLILKINNVLNDEEIDKLINLVDYDFISGGIGTTSDAMSEFRRPKVHWLEYSKEQWIFERIWKIALKFNETYQFRIQPIKGYMQISIYDAEQAGFYHAHLDIGAPMMTRKISISVPLNAPKEYDGGEFQFNYNGVFTSQVQDKGAAIAFPSFLLHA